MRRLPVAGTLRLNAVTKVLHSCSSIHRRRCAVHSRYEQHQRPP